MKLLFCTAVKALHLLLSSNNASSFFFNSSFLSSLAEFGHCIKNRKKLAQAINEAGYWQHRKNKPKHSLYSVHCSILLLPGDRHHRGCKSTFPMRAAPRPAALPGSAPASAPTQLQGIRMLQTGPPSPEAPGCSREPRGRMLAPSALG